jgi:2-dehydro-3-deoxygalactonokinase
MTDPETGGLAVRSWADRGFVAVDWGSSARRAYAIDPDGRLVDQMEDDLGTLTLSRDRFAAEAAALRQRFADRPLLMAGMVGSNRGWVEAPYVPCPATLEDIAARLCWTDPGRVAIVPGLSIVYGADADVMRGEEVQAFGLRALGIGGEDVTICHPGTHTKWIALRGGAIARFRTVMTGELFNLLRRHSILADLMTAPATAGPAFARGVDRGLAGGAIGGELFAIRARVLLGVGAADDAASFASGLLIGNDVRDGLADAPPAEEIIVLGRGVLTALFATAIRQCGRRAREIDGAEAFVAGMRAIAGTIASAQA